MPNKSAFFELHHKQRWSRFVTWQLAATECSVNRLSMELGEPQSRVAKWSRGERGVSSQSAWDTGEALRVLGAQTCGAQALWAAGYFPDLVLLIGHLAAGAKAKSRREVIHDTYLALPNSMLAFESMLCNELAFSTGVTSSAFFETFDSPDQVLVPVANCGAGALDDDVTGGSWWGQNDKHPLEFAWQTLESKFVQAALGRAWAGVVRGAKMPMVEHDYRFYVDADLLDAIFTVAGKWINKRFPTIVGAHVWRLLSEFVSAAAGRVDAQYLSYWYAPLWVHWPLTVEESDFLNNLEDQRLDRSDSGSGDSGSNHG